MSVLSYQTIKFISHSTYKMFTVFCFGHVGRQAITSDKNGHLQSRVNGVCSFASLGNQRQCKIQSFFRSHIIRHVSPYRTTIPRIYHIAGICKTF